MTARVVHFLAPVLSAAYPVVFLFSRNVADQVTTDALWLPLGVAVVSALLATALVALATKDSARAGLTVALLALLFLTYGHAWRAAAEFVDSQLVFIAVWTAIGVVGAWGVWRLREAAKPVSRVVAFAAGCLVVLNGWTIAQHTVLTGVSAASASQLRTRDESLPDVYYLIFDRYAGPTALAETYGYDNEPFLLALEERGFYVARDSHANYPRTPLSLVSSLSMDYLDHEALKEAGEAGRHPIGAMLRGELPVPHTLTGLGYTYVHVGGLWEPSATNVDADVTLGRSSDSEFAAALRESTVLGVLTPHADPGGAGGGEGNPEEEWTADAIRAHSLYQLDRLPKTTTLPSPKYVFAHLALPHPPFVFDADGSRPTPEELEARGERESYIRQLEFANRQILALVDRIVAESPDSIILIQADEGPWPRRLGEEGDDFPWSEFTPAELEEKYGILNAYRVPGVDPRQAGLYPSITPVNSFRVVFNAYFGTDLVPLPDRMYAYPDNSHFYDLVEITDRFEPRDSSGSTAERPIGVSLAAGTAWARPGGTAPATARPMGGRTTVSAGASARE
jgi:hypothetical protein